MRRMLVFATAAAAAAALQAAPVFARNDHPLLHKCGEAAQRYFGDLEARTDMRRSEDRVDGARTVGGDIYLETRSAYVACAFPPRSEGRKLVEFFVDGEDRLAELHQRPGKPDGGAGRPAVGSETDLMAFEGARAGQAENGIRMLGYEAIRSEGLTTYWFNRETGACAAITTSNGRYSDVEMLPAGDC